MFSDWKRIAFALLLVGFQCPRYTAWEPQDPPGETRIEGVVYRGEGKVEHLHDKNPGTVYTPPASKFPFFWVDLGAMYDVTTIQMLAQNSRNSNDMNGINTDFQIASWDTFINPCKPLELYDIMWKMCEYHANFTQKGQLINIKCPRGAAVGHYFRFSRGSPFHNESMPGPYIAELWFYGKKYRDTYQSPEPEDGPDIENVHLKIREELLTGLNQLRVEQSWVEFKQVPEMDDVALGWHHERINAMAVRREKGRILAVLGTQWIDRLHQEQSYAKFKTNVIQWLSDGAVENARFVHANEKFQSGDILVVMRNQTFNVNLVKQAVLNGANPLIVGYVGNREMPSDSATDLLKELGIRVIHNHADYMPRDIPISSVLGSKSYIPLLYTIKTHKQSWKMMRTQQVDFDYTSIGNNQIEEIKSSAYQKELRELLDKYYPYFRDRYPCSANQHYPQDRTKIAWYNYNLYTMAQKSENIVILPGVDIFPGLVSKTETAINHRLTINAPKAGYFYPTGVYVNAGQVFKWKVVDRSHNLNDYYFTIGCHKDNVYGVSPWKRWPRYMHLHQMSTEDSYASPIGGVLFVRVTGDNHNITLELENVYRHPWFDLRNQKSVDDWENERKRYNGVPWMAYMGDIMHVCLPVNEMVKFDKKEMVYVATYYDNVVKIIHNFRGTRYQDDGFQVFATDIQLSAGWGHSGIPIMGYLPWVEAFTNVRAGYNDLRNGMTHEIGHNLQVGACTFKNGGEVTNNVYHFPVFGHLLNITAYRYHEYLSFSDGEMDQVIDIWKGDSYEGVNLGYYNWLGIFFGEGLLMNLFSAAWDNRSKLGSEEAKVNFWLSTMCEETGYNVIPWQELWHFPINQETRDKCAKYPCFFPDDIVTQRVPEIVKRQIEKQPDGCVRQTVKKVQPRGDILHDLNTIRPQFTFFH